MIRLALFLLPYAPRRLRPWLIGIAIGRKPERIDPPPMKPTTRVWVAKGYEDRAKWRFPEEMTLIYPFRDFLEALKEKDAALFARHSHLTPADFVNEWKKVHPEDFPLGIRSEASQRSIVPKLRKPVMS